MCNQIPTCNFCRSKERLVHVNRVAWWLQCHYTITQLVAHQGPYQGVCINFMGTTTKNTVVSHVPAKISSSEIQKHQRTIFRLLVQKTHLFVFSLHKIVLFNSLFIVSTGRPNHVWCQGSFENHDWCAIFSGKPTWPVGWQRYMWNNEGFRATDPFALDPSAVNLKNLLLLSKIFIRLTMNYLYVNTHMFF